MKLKPPSGSNITTHMIDGNQAIIIPQRKPGLADYLAGIFILFWLAGWLMGFLSAFYAIMAGKGGAFLIFWLGAWSIGGVMASFIVYRIFSPTIPETLLLNKFFIGIDTGRPPLNLSWSQKSYHHYWQSLKPNRKTIKIEQSALKTLKLRETAEGNRLTIDKGSARLELAQSASEIEREWLHNYLTWHYRL